MPETITSEDLIPILVDSVGFAETLRVGNWEFMRAEDTDIPLYWVYYRGEHIDTIRADAIPSTNRLLMWLMEMDPGVNESPAETLSSETDQGDHGGDR